MQRTCYLLAGLPGTGKSTTLKFLLKSQMMDREMVVLSTDAAIERYAESVGKTYDEVFSGYIKRATSDLAMQLTHAVMRNKNIIWDQTNLSVKSRHKKLNSFGRNMDQRKSFFNYEYYGIECHYILPPETDEEIKEWHRRLRSREGKTIPDHILRNMRESYVLPDIKREKFDKIVAYDMYGTKIKEETMDK